MIKQEKESTKYMNSVKVGPKGQIVIPKEARSMFDIEPGDTLMLLADSNRGIAIQKFEVFEKVADAIFDGKGKTLYPEGSNEKAMEYAKVIMDAKKGSEE